MDSTEERCVSSSRPDRKKEHQRSLGKINANAAQAILGTVCGVIDQVERGQLTLPFDVSPIEFMLNGGKRTAPAPAKLTIAESKRLYLASESEEAAVTYLGSQTTHLKQFEEAFGTEREVRSIQPSDVENFVRGIRQSKSAQTAIRTRNTLRKYFGWLKKRGYVTDSAAASLPVIRDDRALKTFRTVTQIEETIARGKLTDAAAKQAWKCVFLSTTEIASLLELVRTHCADYRSFLLHSIPAYTGMRRGELLRLSWADVDFGQDVITARSRKQSLSRKETPRRIELHPELKIILSDWHQRQPTGELVVCNLIRERQLSTDEANRLFWSPLRGTTWCLDTKKSWFKLGFHTYRHSFVSNLTAAGVDQRVIREFVGHTSEAIQWRYIHLFPSQRQAAIQKISYLGTPDNNGHG